MNFAKLATAMVAVGLLCGTAQAAEELTGTLKKIKDTGVITLGVRDSSIPFSYRPGRRAPSGYSYDINIKIVEAIKDKLSCRTCRSRKSRSPRRTASPAAERHHRYRVRLDHQ